MPGQLVLQINYIGVKGTHLTYGFDPNQGVPGPTTDRDRPASDRLCQPL